MLRLIKHAHDYGVWYRAIVEDIKTGERYSVTDGWVMPLAESNWQARRATTCNNCSSRPCAHVQLVQAEVELPAYPTYLDGVSTSQA